MKRASSSLQSLTNIQVITRIVKFAREMGDLDKLPEISAELSVLGSHLGHIDKTQALITSLLAEATDGLTFAGFRNFLDCTRMEAYSLEPTLERMIQLHMVRKVGYDSQMFLFRLEDSVRMAIRNNERCESFAIEPLTEKAFWHQVGNIYTHEGQHEFHLFSARYELDTLLAEQPQIRFSQFMAQHSMSDVNRLLLAWICSERALKGSVIFESEDLMISDVEDVLMLPFRQALKGKGELQGILEPPFSEGHISKDKLQLADEVAAQVLEDVCTDGESEDEPQMKGMIQPSEIRAKQLFYNPAEKATMDEIFYALDGDHLDEIQERMRQANFHTCFNILFSGAPGSGKTEGVLQLGRMTNRAVIEVSLAEMRNKYVGEGPKRVQALFDRYAEVCRKSARKPILLLNEADGILTKRSMNADTEAAKEENCTQNIILREMEKLDGILIATTNLQENLDPAMFRRFFYKVDFQPACPEARAHILQAHIEGLPTDLATRLAKEFPLSGGQIENVARRYLMQHVLHDVPCTYDVLSTMAQQELGYKTTHHKAVGFNVAA